jgi:hypothetical protein
LKLLISSCPNGKLLAMIAKQMKYRLFMKLHTKVRCVKKNLNKIKVKFFTYVFYKKEVGVGISEHINTLVPIKNKREN